MRNIEPEDEPFVFIFAMIAIAGLVIGIMKLIMM